MSVSGENTPEFKLITTKTEFDQIETEWTNLFTEQGRGPQLFQTYEWLWHWLHQFKSEPKNIRFLVGYINDELVIAAPLILERPLGIKTLKWAGEPVSQYGDILIKDDALNLQWLKEGFNFLVKTVKPDLFHLRKTRFDAAITPLLENYAATILEETTAPYIDILGAEDFTEFNKRYSQRSRKSKRRHRRKLEEKGELKFTIFEEGPEANRAAIHALNLKRKWLKSLGIISPAFQGTIIDDFFESASKKSPHHPGILVSELCVDDRPAALEIGIKVKNYYGAHLGAYDPDFINHSPGSLQMQDTIAALIDEGVKTIDLFAPGDSYKYEWTDNSVPVYDFAYATSAKGKLFQTIYLTNLRPGLKKLANKMSDIKQSLKPKS